MRGEICKALKLARYKPVQAICTQGEPGDAFYVMLSGSITISKDGRDVNIMSTPGTGFGEVALDRDAVRTHELFVR